MGEALVDAMVAALRRANRDWAETARAPRPQDGPGAQAPAAPEDTAARCGRLVERPVSGTVPSGSPWGCLAHPSLMPTVYSPNGDEEEAASGEEVARRV